VKRARAGGVLLHPTSLPGRFGIGDFGPEARRLVDFLAATGQAYWQIMPLGPTGFGDSPYSAISVFAGNAALISPDDLVQAGFLEAGDLAGTPDFPTDLVGYGKVLVHKRALLERAFDTFERRRADDAGLRRDYEEVVESEAWWLEEYSLFAALKDEYGSADWRSWPAALSSRRPAALERARADLSRRVDAHRFFQYVFRRQWLGLKRHANACGVRIIGDMPLFVAHHSADVWARPELFKLRADRQPAVVAGVPPDAFSATGQLWGCPLYDWGRLRDEGFMWWIERVRRGLTEADVVRIDHFRGLAACWEVPYGHETAERGSWVETPGRELLTAISDALGGGDLPLLAEDLGTITHDVDRLRDDFGLLGMRVLQFAWSGDPQNPHLPHRYTHGVVGYTGTHDNDTVAGWQAARSGPAAGDAGRRELDLCLRYLDTDGAELHWDFIRAVHMSVAPLAITPLQDLLGLGAEARMNSPGRPDGNWAWRARSGVLIDELGERLRSLTALSGRLPEDNRLV